MLTDVNQQVNLHSADASDVDMGDAKRLREFSAEVSTRVTVLLVGLSRIQSQLSSTCHLHDCYCGSCLPLL